MSEAVLRAVARRSEVLRGEDGAYRIGRDEFALILVGATIDGAELVARRIPAAVAADPDCRGVTLSFGTAMLDGIDLLTSVEIADTKLYEAKALRTINSTHSASGRRTHDELDRCHLLRRDEHFAKRPVTLS